MIGAHKTIRSVSVYYIFNCIYAFQFYGPDHTPIFKIGDFCQEMEVRLVVLEEGEAIIGVAAKLFSGSESLYTDFQFQIAHRGIEILNKFETYN